MCYNFLLFQDIYKIRTDLSLLLEDLLQELRITLFVVF